LELAESGKVRIQQCEPLSESLDNVRVLLFYTIGV